jgi:hypothetical protein
MSGGRVVSERQLALSLQALLFNRTRGLEFQEFFLALTGRKSTEFGRS